MGKVKKNSIRIGAAVLLVAAGFFVGWAYTNDSKDNYPLLDPSVESPNLSQTLINFDPLRQEVKAYLADLGIEHSFYFEYLPNGVSIRDGDDQEAIGASLLKTPLVMDLYKLAELKNLNLEQTVKVTESDISSDVVYGDPSGLSEGDTISLRNAARIALQKSDNTAISLVRRTVQPLVNSESDVFENLDIKYTLGDDIGQNGRILQSSTVYISARSYSSVLKCLFYSCFLSPKDSEEIINYLIGSAGQEKLPAGVPKEVKVAHKIGSSLSGDSDCGLFYVPKQPYMLCLIFRGEKTNKPGDTDKYFQHVSKTVYDYVISKK